MVVEPISVVIPAYNEERALRRVVGEIRQVLEQAGVTHEVVIVVDGATDGTLAIAREVADQVVEHPVNLGYGRSLKSGIDAAKYDLMLITDSDGTYPPKRIPDLLRYADRFDMVVGARTGQVYHGSGAKRIGRIVFRWLSEFATGQTIPDINSGMRVFRRGQILPFFPIISSGFSFTTTSTLVYLLNGLLIRYVPIEYHRREGVSKIDPVRDALRALQIILEAILRCNPIKAFLLLQIPWWALAFLEALWGFLRGSALAWQLAYLSAATATLLMGLGFLAAALVPKSKSPVQPIALERSHRQESQEASGK